MTDAAPPASRGLARVLVFTAAVTVAMLVTPAFIPSIWVRMAVLEGAFATLAIAVLPLPWRSLIAVRARDVALGLVAAAGLWLAGALGIAALRVVAPTLADDLSQIQLFAEAIDPVWVVVALPFIVATEDLVWRAAVTLPLAERMRWFLAAPVAGLLFAVAHLTSGPPLLVVAAFACGTVWSAVAITTRRLVLVTTMHLVWDVLVVFVAPY